MVNLYKEKMMKEEKKPEDRLIRELAGLRKRVTELEKSEIEGRKAEEALQKQANQLKERVKELDCVYSISKLMEESGIPLGQIFQGIVELIPPSWQYPEITCARTTLEGKEFKTNNFRETVWKQGTEITVHGVRTGVLEVCYLEERPESDEGPFLKEERRLLKVIAERLGRIIEHKRAEEEYERVFSLSMDMLGVLGFDGYFKSLNPSFERTLGYSNEELLANPFLEFIHAEDRDRSSAALESLAAGTAPVYFENKYLCKDGSYRWLAWNIAPLIEEALMFMVGRDITGLKRKEEERESLVRELEEKTRELELIIHVSSHDLRSPLVNIQGFANEIKESFKQVRSALQSNGGSPGVNEKLDLIIKKDIPEALKYIIASSSKIDALLSGLLRFSRSGSASLSIRKLNMGKLVAEVTKASRFRIKEEGITVEVEELPPCRGDKTQINQVFFNLIDNALKFIDFIDPTRPGMIKVSGEKKDDQVIYCVEDNGIGIAPQHQEKIFEIFHRIDARRAPGEGLGLTIVQRILTRHAGRVWVESEVGKGSKFFISLPA